MSEVEPNVNVSFPDPNWTGHVTIATGNGTNLPNANTVAAAALVAAAVAPLAPPKDWFDTDEPDHPEPLTVEEDGRVHGHLALWDACHVGLLNGQLAECVKPPRTANDYGSFHLGQLAADDGTLVPVGKIVYNGSHAPLTADLVGATQHYDKTGAVAAFVRARDGKHGIYLSGAARSDLSPEGLRDLRANPPSGDWRGLRGRLEMIAALAVPIPGYQTPQMALTADGGLATLILPGFCEDCIEDDEPMEKTRAYVRQRALVSRRLLATEPLEPLVAAPLTSARRKKLATSTFAIPETRSYPIHDAAHARNALARSSGKPEAARVRRAVCRRYPNMGECAK